MEKEQLAELLNGREYRNEISKEEAAMAKHFGLVVVYGASDDLMEFQGAIDEEFGTEALFNKDGSQIEYCDDNCKHYLDARNKANKVTAHFGKNGWTFKTDIPHAKFKINEDGEIYGEAIVFSLSDCK